MTKLASAKAWFEAFEALGWIASQIPDALAGRRGRDPAGVAPSLDPGIDLDVVAKADAIVACLVARGGGVERGGRRDRGRRARGVARSPGRRGRRGRGAPERVRRLPPPPRGEPFAAFAARRRADADASRSALDDALNSTRRAIEDARVEVASEFDRRAAANASRDARAASRDASDRAASGAGRSARGRSRLSDAFAGASSVAALLGIGPRFRRLVHDLEPSVRRGGRLVGADLAYRWPVGEGAARTSPARPALRSST